MAKTLSKTIHNNITINCLATLIGSLSLSFFLRSWAGDSTSLSVVVDSKYSFVDPNKTVIV